MPASESHPSSRAQPYTSDYLVDPLSSAGQRLIDDAEAQQIASAEGVPLEDVLSSFSNSVIAQLRAAEERFNEIVPPGHPERNIEFQRFRDLIEPLQDKLYKRLDHLNKKLAFYEKQPQPNQVKIAEIKGEIDELGSALGYLETLGTENLTEQEKIIYQLFWNIRNSLRSDYGDHVGVDSATGAMRLPTEEEFITFFTEVVYLQAASWNKGEFGHGDFNLMLETGDSITLEELYRRIRHETAASELRKYLSTVDAFFGYATWLIESRRLKIAFFQNYTNVEGLIEKYKELQSHMIRDGSLLDMWKGLQEVKLPGFEVPAVEIGRTATLLYDNLGELGMLKKVYEERLKAIEADGSLNAADKATQRAQAKTDILQRFHRQRFLGGFSPEQAMYLVNNIINFIPWEETTPQLEQQTRAVIQIASAGDIIRKIEYVNNDNTGQYRQLVNSRLVVRVPGDSETYRYSDGSEGLLKDYAFDDGVVYLLDGIPLVPDHQSLPSHAHPDVMQKVTPARTAIFQRLTKMRHYGSRIEQGAYDKFFGDASLAADTVARGYNGAGITGLTQRESYALRYAYSNYAGAPHVQLAQVYRRLLFGWNEQMVMSNPLADQPGELPKISLESAMANPEINFADRTQFNPREQMALGEPAKLAEIWSRAQKVDEIIKDGVFKDLNIEDITSEVKQHGQKIDNFRERLLVILKAFQYLLDFQQLDAPEVVNQLFRSSDNNLGNRLATLIADVGTNPGTDLKAWNNERKNVITRLKTAMTMELLRFSLAEQLYQKHTKLIIDALQKKKEGNLDWDQTATYFFLHLKGFTQDRQLQVSDFVNLWRMLVTDGEILTQADLVEQVGGTDQIAKYPLWNVDRRLNSSNQQTPISNEEMEKVLLEKDSSKRPVSVVGEMLRSAVITALQWQEQRYASKAEYDASQMSLTLK